MRAWAVLFLQLAGATPGGWTLDQIVGGRSPFKSNNPFVYDGLVTIEGGRVTLEWTLNLEGWRPVTEDLATALPKKFSERFIRDVIRGYEPRTSGDGSHLLRVGDWKLRVSGRPDVPGDWKGKFLPDNFSTRIARQLAYHRAEIDAGSRHGLAAGMLLTLYSSKHGATDLRVVSVTTGTAVIENNYGDPPLTKGTRVYSRVPD